MRSGSSSHIDGFWDAELLPGAADRQIRRMISSFSEAGYLMPRPPQPRSCFFEQTVLQGEVRHDLLQGTGLPAQGPDLV